MCSVVLAAEDERLQAAIGLTALTLEKTIDNRALFVAARRHLQDPSHLALASALGVAKRAVRRSQCFEEPRGPNTRFAAPLM